MVIVLTGKPLYSSYWIRSSLDQISLSQKKK